MTGKKITVREVFLPDSIAVIGASSDDQKEKRSWTGNLMDFGYRGRLYPVNPKATSVLGLKCYASITAIEEPVDYAIIALPRELVPMALSDCARKGVRVAHVFTSGFAETASEEGRRLQAEIRRIVERSQTRVIGPNCLGVYCPEGGVTFANLPKRHGSAALISQTGAGAARTIIYANSLGVHFGKAVSYGNAVDLDSTDFLEALIDDPETQSIALYIEGVRDGQRLLQLTQESVRRGKPVVTLKSGLSGAARAAVSSHTGALAGSDQGWQAYFAQSGAIPVSTLEEIGEQLLALQGLGECRGNRVAIIGRGGGPGIIATEICERYGLAVPRFSDETKAKLAQTTTAEAGSIIRNPVEVGIGRAGAQQSYIDAFRAVANSDEIDLILTHLNPEAFILYGGNPAWVSHSVNALLDVFRDLPKPVILVLPPGEAPESREIVIELWARCAEAGLPVFRGYESAARSVSKAIRFYQYHDWLNSPLAEETDAD